MPTKKELLEENEELRRLLARQLALQLFAHPLLDGEALAEVEVLVPELALRVGDASGDPLALGPVEVLLASDGARVPAAARPTAAPIPSVPARRLPRPFAGA